MLRQQPIPWAYRVFFRHIGLDPDQTPGPRSSRSPSTGCSDGRFKSRNRLDDALTIAIAEVGVAVQAFDADRIEGRLGLRLSRRGREVRGAHLAAASRHDRDRRREARRSRSCSARSPRAAASPARRQRTTLVAIRVKGVPDVALEEALWVAASAMLA